MKIGFIGCGKMGEALIAGLVAAGVCKGSEVVATDLSRSVLEAVAARHGITPAPDAAAVAGAVETVVLCVKPADALPVLRAMRDQLRGRLVVSIAAGVTISVLEEAAGEGARIVRVMPNTPALVREGASAFALGRSATQEDAKTVESMLRAVGRCQQVPEELLDVVTGLSGSGPAFVCVAIEALADAGVLMGLPRALALELAAQTVAGTARMVLATGRHPAELKDMVASPGGTTIAGLEKLEQAGLRPALMAAVRAATERARRLGTDG